MKYKGKIIELQEDKGRVIVHYGQFHCAAMSLEEALAKLDAWVTGSVMVHKK